MRTITSLFPAVTFFLAACGGGGAGTGGPPVVEMPDMATTPPDLAIIPYPAGPYGTKVGNTIYPFVGKGYPLSRTVTDSSTFMGKLSDIPIETAFRNAACKCLIISISAEWCGPCNAEQSPEIDGLTADPSLCAYEMLVQGTNEKSSAPANQADLDDWTQRYSHNFPVVLPTLSVQLHLPKANSLPTNVIVDPKTMQIVRIDLGFDSMASYTAKDICGL